MSSFKEDVTEMVLSAMHDEDVLCSKFQLMEDDCKEYVKERIFEAVKEAMELNGYEV